MTLPPATVAGKDGGNLRNRETEEGQAGAEVPPNAEPTFPPRQAPWVIEGRRPPAGWPTRGEVEFRNYSVRYRPGLDLVLKDLSLHVCGGEKVRVGWARAWDVAVPLGGSVAFGRADAPSLSSAWPL